MTEPLEKVDSAVQGLASSPPKDKGHRRASSAAAPGVYNVNDLGEFLSLAKRLTLSNCILIHSPEAEGIDLEIAIETQKTGW